jgi:hypothetical protein
MWHPLSAKLAITSPTSGGRSVGIVRSRIQAMEFSLVIVYLDIIIIIIVIKKIARLKTVFFRTLILPLDFSQ